MSVDIQMGMLPPGASPVEGAALSAWARSLPPPESLRKGVNLERKMKDEADAVRSISLALKEFECALLPIVVSYPDNSIHNWMHVASYHLKNEGMEAQALEDQERCREYVEDALRNYDVRFEFIRDDSQKEGFQIQVLTNW